MKVCVLTTSFPRYKGDFFGSFVHRLVSDLVRLKMQVRVVAPHGKGAQIENTVDGIKVQRFRYAFPDALQRVAYGGGIPANIGSSWLARLQLPLFLICYWFAAIRWSAGCQIVHANWTVSGLIAYLTAPMGKKPLVLTVRGSDIHRFQSGLTGLLTKRILFLMDAVIAVSDDIGKKLESLGVEPKRIHVVYNGVDERFFPRDQRSVRTELKLSATAQIVLFVGLLSPVKGVEYLIEAMESLLRRDRQSNLQCILIGDGPDRQQLEERAKELRIADRCVFLGTVPSEEIPSWLCAADVLALPSLSEGRPNVVLEAQACSIPVVATRVGGTPELICDGQTGILVDGGSSMGMAMGLERVLGDPEFGRRIGMQARLGIEKNGPTWKNAALRTIAIYNQLLSP